MEVEVKRSQPPNPFELENLEPRILLSGDHLSEAVQATVHDEMDPSGMIPEPAAIRRHATRIRPYRPGNRRAGLDHLAYRAQPRTCSGLLAAKAVRSAFFGCILPAHAESADGAKGFAGASCLPARRDDLSTFTSSRKQKQMPPAGRAT